MMRSLVPLILMCTFFALCPCFAGENPFLTSPSSENKKTEQKNIKYPSFVRSFIITLSRAQHTLNKELTNQARKIQKKPSAPLLLTVISIAFIYGVIHALGPGHGKIFALSYFLAHRGSIQKGLVFGNMFAFIHAGSAVVLVLVLYFILSCAAFRIVDDYSRWIRLVSYALITLVGACLFTIKLKEIRRKNTGSRNSPAAAVTRHPAALALSVGIVPCPGTVLVLLFSLSLGMLSLGIVMAFSMALGMAVTLSLIGIATVVLRKSAVGLAGKSTKAGAGITASLELAGALFILVAGGILFFSSI